MEGPEACLGHGRPTSLMWTRSIQAELSTASGSGMQREAERGGSEFFSL